MIFSAPLSPLTHNVFARAPARSWLATGETGCVTFLANTEHDWRYAALQAVHELIEAALHHHGGVTQSQLDACDLCAFERDRPTRTAPHVFAVGVETQLALALGVRWPDYARATAGIHTPPLGADLRQHP